MTQAELLSASGVKTIRKVSLGTTVIEFTNGGVRPASGLELLLLARLTEPESAR